MKKSHCQYFVCEPDWLSCHRRYITPVMPDKKNPLCEQALTVYTVTGMLRYWVRAAMTGISIFSNPLSFGSSPFLTIITKQPSNLNLS